MIDRKEKPDTQNISRFYACICAIQYVKWCVRNIMAFICCFCVFYFLFSSCLFVWLVCWWQSRSRIVVITRHHYQHFHFLSNFDFDVWISRVCVCLCAIRLPVFFLFGLILTFYFFRKKKKFKSFFSRTKYLRSSVGFRCFSLSLSLFHSLSLSFIRKW